MSYKHLTLNQRNKIEVLNKEGYSSRGIAKILGYHHSTIARELKRCNDRYLANDAQKDKEYKTSFKGRKNKASQSLKQIITEKLNSKWSPEQISGSIWFIQALLILI